MFGIIELQDRVEVRAFKFHSEEKEIRAGIRKKFVGKVLPGKGLCVGLHDLIAWGEAILVPGHASAFFLVRFRMMLFAPKVGELMLARVLKSSAEGLQLSTGFHTGIQIPADILRTSLGIPCVFDTDSQRWFWKYEDHKLWIQQFETVRFRVIGLRFETPTPITTAPPPPPPAGSAATPAVPASSASNPASASDTAPATDTAGGTVAVVEKPNLFWIYGAFEDDGTGPISWW
mmetsp:Transcript_14422/g.40958  ORF Transcript_14422/g.40958 Transcript_14422/m.40958 type:complete len:232 (+) Transcript_14422:55-750(+)